LNGKPVRFGSVGGGGRYDGLIGRFRSENVPATGFSIGVSRLYAALKAIGSPSSKEVCRAAPSSSSSSCCQPVTFMMATSGGCRGKNRPCLPNGLALTAETAVPSFERSKASGVP
jgi:histidyl-tRNA synthetase